MKRLPDILGNERSDPVGFPVLPNFTQNTFTACFPDDPTISEEADVDRVVESTGSNSFKVSPNPRALMNESLMLHWHQEEPFMSASIRGIGKRF